jgi:hypothetical protein
MPPKVYLQTTNTQKLSGIYRYPYNYSSLKL